MRTIFPRLPLLAFLMLGISDDTCAFSRLSLSKTPKNIIQDFQSSRHGHRRSRGSATSTIVTAAKSPLFYNPHSQQFLSSSSLSSSSWDDHVQRRRFFQNNDNTKTGIKTKVLKLMRRFLTFTIAVMMMWRGTMIPSTANASTMASNDGLATITTTTTTTTAVDSRTVQAELLSGGGLGGQQNTKHPKSSSNTITIVTAAAIAGAAGSMMGKQIDVEKKSQTPSSSISSTSSSSPLRLGKSPIKKKTHITKKQPGDQKVPLADSDDKGTSANSDSTSVTGSSNVVIKMEPSTSKKTFPILSENRMSRRSAQQEQQGQAESTIPVIAALERTRAQEQVEKVLERVREAQRRAILPLEEQISPPSSQEVTMTTTTTAEGSPLEEETVEEEQEYSATNDIIEDTPLELENTIHDYIDVAKKAEATARALLKTRLAMEAKEKGITPDKQHTTSSHTSTSTKNMNQSQKAEAFARKLLEARFAMEARSKKQASKEASTTLHQNANIDEEVPEETA